MYAILTRPEPESRALANALQKVGFQTWIEPMLEICICKEVVELLSLLSWDESLSVITTSQHAITPLARITKKRDFPLYVVGEASKVVAESLGFRNIQCGDGQASSLLPLIEAAQRKKDHYYYLSGRDITIDICGHMAKQGLACQRYIIYEAEKTSAFSPSFVKLLKHQPPMATLFFSLRSVEAFLSCFARLGASFHLESMTAFTFSEKIANDVRKYPWGNLIALPDGIPKTQEAFVALVEKHKRVIGYVT